jgi:hypothetical protein
MFGKPYGKVQQYKLNVSLLEFIITDSQPFHILKSEGFKKFCLKLDPSFSMPCDKTIKGLISDAFKIGVKKLLSLIVDSSEFISITTDMWTSKSKAGYIGITAHWLDEDFKPYDILLGIEHVLYPHTAEVISNYLEKYRTISHRK